MGREISIHHIDASVLMSELRFAIEYLLKHGHTHCELVFGWHWGLNYPPNAPWSSLFLSLREIEPTVELPQQQGLGALGQDDLHISIPTLGCSFLFCHHSGIHLIVTSYGHIADDFLSRWSAAGLKPIERVNTRDA